MRGKKSRPNFEQAGSTLKDWDFIQETMLSHDEDMIADFMDDIDTLLVFAGLFSAVLTAFLIVSIVFLAPDNTQLSVQLLALIALQNGVPSGMQSFLNSTAEALPTSTEFVASPTAVGINTLWFTSLVLSLAAALFGILAKQWCREYLRWHSVIAEARENVLLRQLRFEEWQKWKVSSYIACIPALLEVALILFLGGLMAFVHMFSQHVLSGLVSLIISTTLLGVFVLTILPVFHRLCPFQTPTGWAFVRMSTSPASLLLTLRLINGFNRALKVLGHQQKAFRSLSQRLHASVGEKLRDWRDYDLFVATSPGLCRLSTPGLENAGTRMGILVGFDLAAVDAVQIGVLIRALSWVQHGLTDQKVRGVVSQCLRALALRNPNCPDQSDGFPNRLAFLSCMHAFCKADLGVLLTMMRTTLYRASERNLTLNTDPPINVELRTGPFVDISQLRLSERFVSVRNAWEDDPFTLELCHALAHFQILSLIDDFLSIIDGNMTEKQRLAETILLLLSMLRCIRPRMTERVTFSASGSMAKRFARTVEEAYTRLASHRAAYSMGLISACVELGRMLAPVTFDFERGEPVMSINECVPRTGTDWQSADESRYVSTWATLALQIHRTTENFKHTDQTHLFVTSVFTVFEVMRARIAAGESVHEPPRWVDWPMPGPGSVSLRAWTLKSEPTAPLIELLSAMVHALEWSLEHRQSDCGAHFQLPWIKSILNCYEAAEMWGWRAHDDSSRRAIPLTNDESMWPIFHRILQLFATCLDQELITAENARDDFAKIIKLTGKFEEQPLDGYPVVPFTRPWSEMSSKRQSHERCRSTSEVSPLSVGNPPDATFASNMLGQDVEPWNDINALSQSIELSERRPSASSTSSGATLFPDIDFRTEQSSSCHDDVPLSVLSRSMADPSSPSSD